MGQSVPPGARRGRSDLIRRAMDADLLDRERELVLARTWRDHDDVNALHELVDSHLRLVVSLATRYRHYGLAVPDLIQEGAVGLMEAAMRFDPEREVRFSTYASWWIRAAIQDFVLRNWSIVRSGTTATQKSLFFNFRRLRARIEETTGQALNHDGRAEIADLLAVGQGDVEAIEWRFAGSDQSLNAPLGETGDGDWQGLLADERPSPEQVTIARLDRAARARWLAEAVGSLPAREQVIIRARRLRDEGATLEELGRHLGVSKERVRQLESRAMTRLRTLMQERVERPHDLLADA
ncbi:MAG: RNA polymerase factor sigma-32 [Kiloniellales bacterium]